MPPLPTKKSCRVNTLRGRGRWTRLLLLQLKLIEDVSSEIDGLAADLGGLNAQDGVVLGHGDGGTGGLVPQVGVERCAATGGDDLDGAARRKSAIAHGQHPLVVVVVAR